MLLPMWKGHVYEISVNKNSYHAHVHSPQSFQLWALLMVEVVGGNHLLVVVGHIQNPMTVVSFPEPVQSPARDLWTNQCERGEMTKGIQCKGIIRFKTIQLLCPYVKSYIQV